MCFPALSANVCIFTRSLLNYGVLGLNVFAMTCQSLCDGDFGFLCQGDFGFLCQEFDAGIPAGHFN